MNDLTRRLKDRKLVQWALAYLGGAWVLLQLLAMLAAAYAWPLWVMRAVPVALAAGLLVTLVLSWYHGEKGRQRVTGAELLLVGLILLLAGGAIAFVGGRPGEAGGGAADRAATVDPRSVAVLPFVNGSGDAGQEYFSDGLTEELLLALAQVQGLWVPARTSSFYFKGRALPVPEIAAQLGVAYVLEGSVLRADAGVRIVARLVDGRTDRQIWSNSYERSRDDVFAIQIEIARAVAQELKLQLGSGAAASPTVNAAAHDLYLQGLFHWNRRTGRDVQRAVDLFEQATTLDDRYARAHAGLALAYAVLPLYTGWSALDALSHVERSADRALAADSSLADAYAALGYAYHWVWRWADARHAFERAVAIEPDNSATLQWYGEYLMKTGRQADGIATLRRAVELDPFSLAAHGNLGVVLAIAGRHVEAVAQLERTLAMDPSFAFPLALLHKLYLLEGRHDDALHAGRRWAELSGLAEPDDIETIVAGARDAAGRAAALDVLARWERRPQPLWLDIVFYYVHFAEHDRALAALQRGVDQRSALISSALTTPWFEPLRADPRFEPIVSVMRAGENAHAEPARRAR